MLMFSGEVGIYITAMLKAFGVALISHICAEVCRECKSTTLADTVLFAGKVELLLLCIQPVTEILKNAAALL